MNKAKNWMNSETGQNFLSQIQNWLDQLFNWIRNLFN